MKPASFLALVVCAPILLASSVALAAPGKTAKGPKKKPKTATVAPMQEAEPAPAPTPVAPITPVAPETKAADSKPAEAQPVPMATDHATKSAGDDDDASSKPIAVAPLLGFGTNHLNFGVGARAGYTLPQKVYIGGTFMYHFGESQPYGLFGQVGEVSTKIFYPAAEVGYDFHVGPATIRPYAGVGVVFVSASVTVGNQSSSASDNSFAFYPGATAQWNIPRSAFFVGADTRLLILTRGGDPSFGFFATGGMKF